MSGINLMEKYCYGDVVIFESSSLEGKLISLFTGNEFNHSALITRKNHAKNVIKNGLEDCDLSKPDDRYNTYLILEHKNIDDIKRLKLEVWDSFVNTELNKESILRLGLRYISGKKKDSTQIIESGKFNCSSRIAFLYGIIGLPILNYVNYTQIIPSDFIESPYFDLVDSWRR